MSVRLFGIQSLALLSLASICTAAGPDHMDVARLLLEHGAHVNAADFWDERRSGPRSRSGTVTTPGATSSASIARPLSR